MLASVAARQHSAPQDGDLPGEKDWRDFCRDTKVSDILSKKQKLVTLAAETSISKALSVSLLSLLLLLFHPLPTNKRLLGCY